MKRFKEIFDTAMVEITPTDIAMLGKDVPVVSFNSRNYADFVSWANKAFSPHLVFSHAYICPGACVVAKIDGIFNEKSASTLKANGITEWAIKADEENGEYSALYLNIPCIPDE